jgi:hypothetical protein
LRKDNEYMEEQMNGTKKIYQVLLAEDDIEGIRNQEGCPPVILITAFGDKETHAKAKPILTPKPETQATG